MFDYKGKDLFVGVQTKYTVGVKKYEHIFIYLVSSILRMFLFR
jgi:hypothetical protein